MVKDDERPVEPEDEINEEDEEDESEDDADDDYTGHQVGDNGDVIFVLEGSRVNREDYLAARVGELADALGALAFLAKGARAAGVLRQTTDANQSTPTPTKGDGGGMFGLGGKEGGG